MKPVKKVTVRLIEDRIKKIKKEKKAKGMYFNKLHYIKAELAVENIHCSETTINRVLSLKVKPKNEKIFPAILKALGIKYETSTKIGE